MSEPNDLGVAPGDLLAGRYRVDRILGRGGMGVVVAASHPGLGRRVAIKLLLPELAREEEIVARFLREAQAASRITSEHAVRVLDVGTLENGAPYLVMEYLLGQDLEALLEQRTVLPVHEAVDYVLQALVALAEAHAAGFIHRDLKPANLFLCSRPDGSPLVKLLDFGISKATHDRDTQGHALTRTSSGMMGSPLYMSPEQIRSAKNVDARSDLWSVGVILYELLTGKPPFDAETVSGLLAAIMVDQVTPISQRRSDVPSELEAVILRCLSKDAAQRPASAAELAAALTPFASPLGRSSAERIAARERPHSGVDPRASWAGTEAAATNDAPQTVVARSLAGEAPRGSIGAGLHPGASLADPKSGTAIGWQAAEGASAPAKRKGAIVLVGVAALLGVGGAVGAYLTLGGGSSRTSPAAVLEPTSTSLSETTPPVEVVPPPTVSPTQDAPTSANVEGPAASTTATTSSATTAATTTAPPRSTARPGATARPSATGRPSTTAHPSASTKKPNIRDQIGERK